MFKSQLFEFEGQIHKNILCENILVNTVGYVLSHIYLDGHNVVFHAKSVQYVGFSFILFISSIFN